MEEIEVIRESRDNLRIKMDEVEESVREAYFKSSSEMERLKKELNDRVSHFCGVRDVIYKT